MEQLSMVKAELLDEYQRFKRAIEAYQNKIARDHVKGYLGKKRVKNHEYYYLRWREGDRIRSKYVKLGHVDIIKENIERRKQEELRIKRFRNEMKEIEAFLGKDVLIKYLGEDYGVLK